MEDVLSPEGIGKSTNDKDDKEQQTTIQIRDNDEQQNAIENSDDGNTEKDAAEQVHDVPSIAGFAQKNIKQG